ncbi:MAG TPA: flagellar basal body protein, partial [Candidatus Acidoferrum sp.]|nr:flagellar basal body protein [Candidatus Acidoferrum sp.]
MDLLRLGSTSLLNMQQALAITGHNISNANTDGYSRQTVNLAAQSSNTFGYGSVGEGAYVSSITRSSDAFMTAQVQNYSSSESR